jgi:hypothetical protein
MLPFFAVSTFTGADCGMAWLATGMAKTTPTETAVTTANALMLNTIRYSFYFIKKLRALIIWRRHKASRMQVKHFPAGRLINIEQLLSG